jgi:hypothetical protein
MFRSKAKQTALGAPQPGYLGLGTFAGTLQSWHAKAILLQDR